MVNRRKDSGSRHSEFDKTRIALSEDGLLVEGDSRRFLRFYWRRLILSYEFVS